MSDIETSHEARAVEAEQYQERQRRKRKSKENESWYEAVGQKVVKKTRSALGHVQSVYVGRLTKETAHLVQKGK